MPLPYNQRTCYCGQVGPRLIGQSVVLVGWVAVRRDHGGMVFIDLRDREGVVQLKFNPESDPRAHEAAGRLRTEFCIAVRGEVARRPAEMVNPSLSSGEVEVNVHEIDILSACETPKFEIGETPIANEELRLKYRYLDLRRPPMQRALITRHRITKLMRDYFDEHGFVEIETPFLTKSTPEGARDFLVPSRIHPGQFYALPQSPQLFKQLLMMSGFDRYVQIVRCFRDEDARGDRQPEFTQLDLEMSFIQPQDVMNIVEGLLARIMKLVHNVDVPTPFPRMSYQQAMLDYGIDRPDTRYDLRIRDVSDVVRKTDFKVFRTPLEAGGVCRAIRVPGGAEMSQREIEKDLTEFVKGSGAGGLPYLKVGQASPPDVKFQTGVAKFFSPELTRELERALQLQPGDAVFFAADTEDNVCRYLSRLREEIARRRGLIPEGQWNFLWVVDFPMFLFNPEDKRHYAVHHPFTAPLDEDVHWLEKDPTRCRAKAYDVVLNGIELGGGSVRIHRTEVQQQVFRILNMSEAEQQARFGFLLDALRHGPPPHGGIALGLDRLVMLMIGADNIREAIAFPKVTKTFICPLTEAPSPVSQEQLDELSLRIALPQKK
ncbi:MAG: aspartate--tRNA ligase [Phycisphaerae bacterium]|nr:aspartate--tRNA ligase [Phycisphaerae bacterium]